MKHVVIDRPHTVSSFDNQLAEVKTLINRMSDLALRSLDEAIVALETNDRDAAKEIIAKDQMIDDLELSLERLVLLTITSRGPMASDLRFLIVAIRVGKMLERTGDQAKRIARRVKKLDPDQIDQSLAMIRPMAEYANEMVAAAIDSFNSQDAKIANDVIEADAKLNTMHKKLIEASSETMRSGSEHVDHGVQIISIGKQLERVGDYATNIAQEVIYMVSGAR